MLDLPPELIVNIFKLLLGAKNFNKKVRKTGAVQYPSLSRHAASMQF
jgi:hypothetical protein